MKANLERLPVASGRDRVVWLAPGRAGREAALRLAGAAAVCGVAFWPGAPLPGRFLGWMSLAAIALPDLRASVALACFFATFFNNFGALEPGLFLRPVHLVAVCMLVRLARDLQETRMERELEKTLAWCCAPLALIAVLTYLAGATAPDASFAIKGVMKFSFGILLFLELSFALRDRSLARWAMAGFFAGAGLKAMLMLGTLGHVESLFGETLRLNHSLATLSASAAVLAFAGLLTRRGWPVHLLRFSGVLLLLGVAMLSLSRSAWVGWFAGFAATAGMLFLGLSDRALGQKRFLTWALMSAVIGGALAIWAMGENPDLRSRVLELQGLIRPSSLQNTLLVDDQGGFLGQRVHQVSEAMNIVRKNPILGVGFTQKVVSFRSGYLNVLAGSGIAGFLAFLLFAVLYLQLLYDAARREEGRSPALAAVGVQGAVVAWLVASLAENLLFGSWVWVLLALGMGCVFATFRPAELWRLVRHRSQIWGTRFALAAAYVLILDPGMRWSWRVSGWLILTALALLDPTVGLRSLFFLSPFFVHYGVFEVPLGMVPFHIKPLHVAYGVALATLTLRRGSLDLAARGQRLLVPLALFCALAFSSALWSPDPSKTLRTSLNLAALAAIFGTAFVWISDWAVFRRCLNAFLCGMLVRLAVVLFNELLATGFFDEMLPHNHHIALLAVTGSGLAAALFAQERESSWRRAFYVLVCLVAGAAILFSLARAAWLAAAAGFLAFCASSVWLSKRKRMPLGMLAWAPLGLGLLLLAVRLFYWKPEVAARVRSILSLADLDYLRDCVRDRLTGGHAFGVRLRQVLDFLGVFRANWLLGTGFTVTSLGYHGLAYTLLASCGLAGFSLAGWFAWRWVAGVAQAVREVDSFPKALMGLGLLASFLAWLLYSVSETLFLQFDVWVLLTSGAVYAKLAFLDSQRRAGARAERIPS